MKNNSKLLNVGAQLVGLLLISFIFHSCKGSKSSQEGELIISQQRLECMGNCPVYTISVYDNGKVEYSGEKNVPKTGSTSFKLSKTDLIRLKEAFEKANFFEFEKRYTQNVSDGSTTYIYYKNDGKELKIMDHIGAPDALKELEILLENMIFGYLNQ